VKNFFLGAVGPKKRSPLTRSSLEGNSRSPNRISLKNRAKKKGLKQERDVARKKTKVERCEGEGAKGIFLACSAEENKDEGWEWFVLR